MAQGEVSGAKRWSVAAQIIGSEVAMDNTCGEFLHGKPVGTLGLLLYPLTP